MSEFFEKVAQRLLSPLDRAIIKLLGLYTMAWGFWVANPFWNVFEQAMLFEKLGEVAPEIFWGTLAFVVGTGLVIACAKKSKRWLLIFSGALGWHWFMLGIFYFLGDWQNTGGITSILLAIYAVVVYLNLKVNTSQSGRTVDEILH